MPKKPRTDGIEVVLVDGPAAGHYATAFTAAPEQLTAVVSTIDGAAAVLDLPSDVPALGENAVSYRRNGAGHACGRPGGCTTWWLYELVPETWQGYTPLRAVPQSG